MAQNQFLYITSEILSIKTLNTTEKLIYAYIKSFIDNHKSFYASYSHIANFLGISRKTAINSIQKLINKGYLSVEITKGINGRNNNPTRELKINKNQSQKIDYELAKKFEKIYKKVV